MSRRVLPVHNTANRLVFSCEYLSQTLKLRVKIARNRCVVYSAAMAKDSRLSWIISRISQTHFAHWAVHWLRAKTSRGRFAPASMAAATSRLRRPLQLQTYTAGRTRLVANGSL